MSLFSFFSRRAGLQSLSALDDRMLNDLGLSRSDLVDAGRMGAGATSLLSERRNQRASSWMR